MYVHTYRILFKEQRKSNLDNRFCKLAEENKKWSVIDDIGKKFVFYSLYSPATRPITVTILEETYDYHVFFSSIYFRENFYPTKLNILKMHLSKDIESSTHMLSLVEMHVRGFPNLVERINSLF